MHVDKLSVSDVEFFMNKGLKSDEVERMKIEDLGVRDGKLVLKPKPEKGVKLDSDKDDWSLLPYDALEEIVKVLMFGAKKYSPDNWRVVPSWRKRYFSALMRHVVKWFYGNEKKDAESGLSPLAHAACCVLFLLAKDIEQRKTEEKSEV